jgi:hypothetical protein
MCPAAYPNRAAPADTVDTRRPSPVTVASHRPSAAPSVPSRADRPVRAPSKSTRHARATTKTETTTASFAKNTRVRRLSQVRVVGITPACQSAALFALAAIAEIGGAWLVWQGVREHRGVAWMGAGIAALAAYGFVATLQDEAHFGRILAAYGGIFVVARWPGASSPTASAPTATTSPARPSASSAWPSSCSPPGRPDRRGGPRPALPTQPARPARRASRPA